MPDKKPRGAPVKEDGEVERYELRLSTKRRERYEEAAKRAGRRLAAWIKGVLDRASRSR